MRATLWCVWMGIVMGILGGQQAVADGTDVIQGSPIPAIDNPRYVSVGEADRFMRPDEPVLGITDGKVAKAYSTWQLNHHEIVNDSLGDLPLAVTW